MKKQNSKTPSTQDKPKTEIHITFNLDEFAALEKLGFRERWAYFVFKRYANFKTGVFGEHLSQKYSLKAIADLIKPPPGIQGRGEGGIDDTQAHDFLIRMEALGLVSGIGRRRNGGLRFDLPMSPRDRKKTNLTGQSAGEKADILPETAVQSAGEKMDIFPEAAAPEIAANPAPVCDFNESAPPLSVLINTKTKNISIEGADPSNDGTAPDRAFGATPCRADGAASLRENPGPVAGAPATLSAQQIHDALADTWNFTETGTPEAWRLYESWAGNITLDDLHAAMTGVEEGEGNPDPTPADLKPRLWPMVADSWYGRLSA
jgi:hypothetical protein